MRNEKVKIDQEKYLPVIIFDELVKSLL